MLLIVSVLVACTLTASLAYCVLIVMAAHNYLQQSRGVFSRTPVSVLKPLSGADEGLEANLRSFFVQDHGAFEILAAVREPDDAAVAIFEKLQSEYPHVESRLILTGEPPYPNAKVFSLARMLQAARYDLLVMSDSDIRVESNMLSAVAAEFEDPKVALATCPYRAVAGDSLWSKLEALGMNTEFLGGLLVARMLMGVDFAVGPTIVARREALERVGLDRLKEYLAEDFVMGQFAARAGLGVILSRTIVEHHIGSETFRKNASHRLRWARSTRRSRPAGYVGQLFTNPLPVALLLVALQPAWWPVFVIIAPLRYLAAWVLSGRILRDQSRWSLLAVQDFLSFGFWLAGFWGNTITWRGRRYYLHPDGRFELLA